MNGLDESPGVNGLDQVRVEARVLRKPAIFGPPVAGDGDKDHPACGFRSAQAARQLTAVKLRQPDVDDGDIGLQLERL